MPACCFLAVVTLREERRHAPARVASAEGWSACVQVMADDAEELLSSVQKENCTGLLWRGCQTQVAQHISVTMLSSPMSLACYLSFSDRKPVRDIDGAIVQRYLKQRSCWCLT